MPLTPQTESCLDDWCRFLGYGNPAADLWVVGIEEGGATTERYFSTYLNQKRSLGQLKTLTEIEKSRLTYLNFTYGELLCERKDWSDAESDTRRLYTSSVWAYSSKLAALFNGLSPQETQRYQRIPKEYQEVWLSKSKIFLSNAYPLGKKRATNGEWPYERILGVGFEEYKMFVKGRRPDYLRGVRPVNAVVVAHGKTQGVRELHKEAFLKPGDLKVSCDDHLEVYADSKLILTPFFGRGMSNLLIEKIATIARDLCF